MQYVESSVIGTIEVDSPHPIEFDPVADQGSKPAESAAPQRPLRRRIHFDRSSAQPDTNSASAQDKTADNSPVIAFRLSCEAPPGTHLIDADLARLEADLDGELRLLRARMAERV
jgi:hypothetical protein